MCPRYVEHDRGVKPSTLRGYRSAIEAHLLPAVGSLPVEDVTTTEIERWMAGFDGSARTRNKLLIQLHGILGRARKAYGRHRERAPGAGRSLCGTALVRGRRGTCPVVARGSRSPRRRVAESDRGSAINSGA